MPKDPICGMDVDPKKAKFMLKKNNKNYYFCSKNCFEQFNNPKKDTGSKEEHKGHHADSKGSKAIIPIKGMSCASCVARIEKNLKKQEGVTTANVNLATGKATVEFDLDKIAQEKIEQTIKDIGYEVEESKSEKQSKLQLKVIGMDNPHCIGIVGSALGKLKGVISKELLPTEKASIVYDPKVIDSGRIRQTIKDAGYENFPDTDSKDEEKKARDKEIKTLKYKTLASMILGLPLLYFAMGPHIGLPVGSFIEQNMALIQFIIATRTRLLI